jgi:alkylhydroperoxidase family enzyme
MGHSEMLLAVAGLDNQTVIRRIEHLACGDWSAFSPAERTAFRFARKQAKEPASITEEDFRLLVDHFGPDRSLDVVWWSCRCHYMTRVADALGLPLEPENVFDGFRPARSPASRER